MVVQGSPEKQHRGVATRMAVAASAVALGITAASALAPATAAAQSAASSEPGGSLQAAQDAVRSSLGLIANGSAFNSDAPTLAPLSAGSAPLSAASAAGGTGSITVPLLTGATLAMSLVPVGSLANSAQLAGLFFGPDVLTNAAGSFTGGGYTVPQPDPNIAATELLSVTPVDIPEKNLEIWKVASASMGRTFDIEVYRPAANQGPAPVLYMLEGVDTVMPTPFRTNTDIARRARDENVIAVAPSGAPGANWAEWIEDDPRLSRNKWETFLIDEFPALLRSETQRTGLSPSGKYGVVGLSMGGGSALRLAANHPGFFAAAGGVSGCYGTTDDLGFETVRLNVETRGGNLANMWGPRGSEKWRENDVPAHAENLRGTKVFMSSATGAFGAEDVRLFGDNPGVLFSGNILEAGARECSNRMGRALDRAGVPYEHFQMPTGIHNWTAFGPGMAKAFDTLIPAMR